MAVAVKNPPESRTSNPLDRLSLVSLAGAIYTLGSVAVVFKLVPKYWWDTVGATNDSFLTRGLLAIVMVAVAAGLVWLGTRLAGPKPIPGLRAGVFVCILGFCLAAALGLLVGRIAEPWTHTMGPSGSTLGMAITLGLPLVLLVLGFRWLSTPAAEKSMIGFEEQGWFSFWSYKRSQGLKVRRGTMFGVLLIAGCGIWTLLHNNVLRSEAAEWRVGIPFTAAEVLVQSSGDTGLEKGAYLARETFEEANRDLADALKVTEAGDSDFTVGKLVRADEFKKVVAGLEAESLRVPKATDPVAAVSGAIRYQPFTLMQDMPLTVPLLLGALAIWFAWRLVNYPAFADFLIATEAELNKVSWSSAKRLRQDTVVVIVTMIMMAVFLLVVDVLWGWILASRYVGVLRVNQNPAEAREEAEVPW